MSMGTISLLVVLGLLLIVIVWSISIYNGLVSKRNEVKNAFSQIDVQLKRRFDLIPNLLEAVKGYMKHERETLQAVTEARNSAISAARDARADPTSGKAIRSLGSAQGTLDSAVGRLMISVEAYPDLKASSNMEQLQEELSSTENKVAFARQAFNDSVYLYNNSVQHFPDMLIAGIGKFNVAEHLESTKSEAEREAPKVSF